MSESKKVTLGSGYAYIMEFDGSIPEDSVIETDQNRLAYIKSGATVTYTPTFYEAKDDNDDVIEEYLTDEVITLRLGLMTWTGNTLARLSSTARVSEADGVRTVKVGGLSNHDHKKYLVRFVHKSGALRVTIAGSNQNGFELAFAKDTETVPNAEFRASKSLDNDGTKLIYTETLVPLEGLTVTSEASATTDGKSKISITEEAGTGNSFVYKVGKDAAVTVVYGQDLASWAMLISGNEYKLTTGQYITVAEITATGEAVKAGSTTITSK